MGKGQDWYYSNGGQGWRGPLPWEQLEAAYRAGMIAPESVLWTPALEGWVEARALLEPEPVTSPRASASAAGPPPAAGAEAPAPPREPAPGARAGRACAIWALATALLCFPVSLVLAVLALVKTRRAIRLAEASPERYRRPGRAGIVLGFLALALPVGLLAIALAVALALPARRAGRDQARDRVAIHNLETAVADLVAGYREARAGGQPLEQIPRLLEDRLRRAHGRESNPWKTTAPAFAPRIFHLDEADPAAVEEAARAAATEPGQGILVVQMPSSRHPGWITGAVQLAGPPRGARIHLKAVPLGGTDPQAVAGSGQIRP